MRNRRRQNTARLRRTHSMRRPGSRGSSNQRVSQRNSRNDSAPVCEHQSQFNFIWKDSRIDVIDVSSCVSILRTRKKSEYGVSKLARLVRRNDENHIGHKSAAALPIVAEIPNDFLDFVEEHFRENLRLDADRAREQVYKVGQVWYAIVDVDHRHDALLLEGSKIQQNLQVSLGK